MRTTLFALLVLFGITGYSQGNLNDYKYIIVPKKFDNFKNANQYQTSTLIKYLFTQKGFLTVYDDQFPQDLAENRCLGLECDLRDASNLFTTKASIALVDCNGKEIMVTHEAKSKIKEYREAYEDVIKKAMRDFDGIPYKYIEKEAKQKPVVLRFKNDVKKLEEDTATTKADVQKQKKPLLLKEKNEPKNVSVTVQQKATEKEQFYKNIEPVASDIGPGKATKATPKVAKKIETWYAQELPNGYQLVDSSPKIRMTLLKSSTKNVYMAQSDGKNGMVYQTGNTWVFEYYVDGNLVQEELRIKF